MKHGQPLRHSYSRFIFLVLPFNNAVTNYFFSEADGLSFKKGRLKVKCAPTEGGGESILKMMNRNSSLKLRLKNDAKKELMT